MKVSGWLCVVISIIGVASPASADVLQMGADCLAATQNSDGGWDWPLINEGVEHSDAPNTLAPTGMGLLGAYLATGDPAHFSALQKAGQRLLNKTPQEITPDDGCLAVALDNMFEVTTHRDFLGANFYEPLAEGTYDYLGDGSLLVDAELYVFLLRFWRDYDGVSNLAALDCGLGLYAASLMEADVSAWLDGTKTEIEELDSSELFDVLGLAGAVLGLAADLGAILAGYQLPSGGVTWNAAHMAEEAANETVQETAYTVLALREVDSHVYHEEIARAAAYLESVQLPTGGWENFLGQGENNEITGESLWALALAQEVAAQEQPDLNE